MSSDFILRQSQDPESQILRTGGMFATTAVELTRPADVLAYTVGDSVNSSTTVPTAMTFPAMGLGAGDDGYLIKAQLVTDQAACVAQLRLWLFNVATPFLNVDNAAFLIKYADRATRLGYIDFPALATEAGSDCAIALAGSIRLAYVSAATNEIYGVLQTKTAFTPASAQKFYVQMTAEQN